MVPCGTLWPWKRQYPVFKHRVLWPGRHGGSRLSHVNDHEHVEEVTRSDAHIVMIIYTRVCLFANKQDLDIGYMATSWFLRSTVFNIIHNVTGIWTMKRPVLLDERPPKKCGKIYFVASHHRKVYLRTVFVHDISKRESSGGGEGQCGVN